MAASLMPGASEGTETSQYVTFGPEPDSWFVSWLQMPSSSFVQRIPSFVHAAGEMFSKLLVQMLRAWYLSTQVVVVDQISL